MNANLKKLLDVRADLQRELDKAIAHMPEKKRLDTLNALIAEFDGGTTAEKIGSPNAEAIRRSVLTTPAQKEKILAAVDSHFLKTDNKPVLPADLLSILNANSIDVPGKTPASTLTALISKNKKYQRTKDGYCLAQTVLS